jgi:hypothetical protein
MPSLTNAQINTIRGQSDLALQHYNYTMTSYIDWSVLYQNGDILASEMTNRINREENKYITCHARPLINALALSANPIKVDEQYYLDVRYKQTRPRGEYEHYFNLDIVLPNRPARYELCHISFHTTSAPPWYKSVWVFNPGTPRWARARVGDKRFGSYQLTDEVNESKSTARTITGALHLKESENISTIPGKLRRYIIYKHDGAGGGRDRFEILLVKQLSDPRRNATDYKMFPMTYGFSKICLEVLQEYLDDNQQIRTFETPYDDFTGVGDYADEEVGELPPTATELAKNRGNGLDWAKIQTNNLDLGKKILCNVNTSENLSAMKINAYRLLADRGILENDDKYYPSYFSIDARVEPLLGIGKISVIYTLKYNIYKFSERAVDNKRYLETLFNKAKDDLRRNPRDGRLVAARDKAKTDYDNAETHLIKKHIPISKFTMQNNIPAGNALTAVYKGMVLVEDIVTPGGRATHHRRYTVETEGGAKQFTPLSQSGPITSVTAMFGQEVMKAFQTYINGGYKVADLKCSYYDCSGTGDARAIDPPDPLPRIGGARKTRSGRSKKRQTRKTKKRT